MNKESSWFWPKRPVSKNYMKNVLGYSEGKATEKYNIGDQLYSGSVRSMWDSLVGNKRTRDMSYMKTPTKIASKPVKAKLKTAYDMRNKVTAK